jgi:tetratricopeptide (TPR) repeat protein
LARASELTLYTRGAEKALAVAERARDAAADAGDPSATAEAQLACARVHLRRHTDTALDDAAAALDAMPEENELSPAQRATALKLRGIEQARRGHSREALERFEAAYDIAAGNPNLRARVLLTHAVQLRNWGLFGDAQRKAERSLEIRLQLGDHYGSALCYGTLAFIYQRQGLWEQERDALVADLRVTERIGATADEPALHGRLAGALIGLGKYAGAWAEAELAIELENARLDLDEVDVDTASRTHGYAWREQARVKLARNLFDDGLDLATRARETFARLNDGYGQALCMLTKAELLLARARNGDADASARLLEVLADARPTFVRLGAVPEAAETILIEVESRAIAGDDTAAALIVQQVLPMLQQAGLGDSELFRRARDVAERIAPSTAFDRAVTQAAMLRSLAGVLTEAEPQDATVVAVRAGDEASALVFARAAVDKGAVVLWPDSEVGVAVLLGAGHSDRATALSDALDGMACASADGTIDLEHMWPAGVRARGAALEAALEKLSKVSP